MYPSYVSKFKVSKALLSSIDKAEVHNWLCENPGLLKEMFIFAEKFFSQYSPDSVDLVNKKLGPLPSFQQLKQADEETLKKLAILGFNCLYSRRKLRVDSTTFETITGEAPEAEKVPVLFFPELNTEIYLILKMTNVVLDNLKKTGSDLTLEDIQTMLLKIFKDIKGLESDVETLLVISMILLGICILGDNYKSQDQLYMANLFMF
jgi:hypothetical protein